MILPVSPLAGPVYIDGAGPGDALVVDVLEVGIDDFGWSCIVPGLGLLDKFKEPFPLQVELGEQAFR